MIDVRPAPMLRKPASLKSGIIHQRGIERCRAPLFLELLSPRSHEPNFWSRLIERLVRTCLRPGDTSHGKLRPPFAGLKRVAAIWQCLECHPLKGVWYISPTVPTSSLDISTLLLLRGYFQRSIVAMKPPYAHRHRTGSSPTRCDPSRANWVQSSTGRGD